MPILAPRPLSVRIDRWFRKIRDDGGCWIWRGYINRDGYGQVGRVDDRTQPLHRVMYAYFVSEIPPGLELDHLCEQRACCNPWHLEPVTHSENMRRRWGT